MKKKLWILCAVIAVAALAAACGSVSYGSNETTFPASSRGAIGAFSIIAPAEGTVNSALPEFRWTAAENAETYRLEIAEDADFTAIVFRKVGLTNTEFAMTSTLGWRTDYWWRVTALNADTERTSDIGTFRCKLSGAAAETRIPLSGPYAVNGDGFAVDVETAADDPLGTGRETVRMSWADNAVGWCVVSETVEVAMNAADAISVTFCHTTDLGSINLRFLEQDSDLWVADIPSRAGKNQVQTAIVPYSAFQLRADESFGDGEINFEYVQRLDFTFVTYDAGEICFGDLKTVCIDDYPDPVADEIDLGTADAYMLNSAGYAFGVAVDGSDLFGNGKATLVLDYSADIAPIGWGIATRSLGVDLADGDALMLNFKYAGTAGIFRVRLVEGDGDVWTATLNAPAELASRVLVRFADLQLREDISTGDGKCRMDRLLSVDFCVEGMYGAGTAMFNELRIVTASDYEEEEPEFGFRNVYGDHMVLQRGVANVLRGYGAAGTRLTISFDGETDSVVVGADGVWSAELPVRNAGGSYEIAVSDGTATRTIGDVTFGDVYFFAGQSNMLFRLAQVTDSVGDTANGDLRLFFQAEQAADAPADSALNGNWQRSDSRNAGGYSAIAWMVGSAIQRDKNVPIGIVTAAVGSTSIEYWMSADGYSGEKSGRNRYYNGMVAPLTGLQYTAAIWYQGEDNCGWPQSYVTLLQDLMTDWRTRMGAPELPFFVVQLPVYDHDYNWAYLREAQAAAVAASENAYLITTMDGGDSADIHPTRKQYIADRIAASIARHVYGDDVNADAPLYRGYEVAGDAMTLTFAHAAGLRLEGEAVGFELAGADGRFLPATAMIEGETVTLRATGIDAPVYARYAYTSAPTACLFNGAGLPVGSFSTYFGNMYGVTHDLGAGAWSKENGTGNDPAFTIGSDGETVTIAYNNVLEAGWGNVNLALASPLSGGDTLFFRASVTGTPVSFALRLVEVDGDMWTAPFTIGEDGTVWIPFSDFTYVSGWGDRELDLNNLIKTLTVSFGACYSTGVLSLSDLRVLNAADRPVAEAVVRIVDDFESGVNSWKTIDPKYGGVAEIAAETAAVNVARGAQSARLCCLTGKGDAEYKLDLTSQEGAEDRLFFRMKGDGKSILFVYLYSGEQSYHIQINQPAAEWQDYCYPLSRFDAALTIADVTAIKFALQDWASPGGSTWYTYLDDLLFCNRLGEAEIPAANPPPAPVRTVIEDFENGVSDWTAAQVQDFASITVSDVHNGGTHGAQLRYAAGAADASFARPVDAGMQGDTLGFWLKGTPSATVIVQLHLGEATFKYFVAPGRACRVRRGRRVSDRAVVVSLG